MENSQSGFFQRRVCGKFKLGPGLAEADKPAVWTMRTWCSRRWRAYLHTVAAVTLAWPAFSAPEFTLTNVALPGVADSSVVCGDFNNDGQPDVLLSGVDGQFTGICQIWQNHSFGLFTNLNAGLPGISSSAVARGDFNNDGRHDLLLTGFAGMDVNHAPIYLSQVWRNLGNGTFTNIQAACLELIRER